MPEQTDQPLLVFPERLRRKIYIDPASGCWVWTGSKTSGYGYVSFGDKSWRVHRLAMHLFGKPMPPGLVCDHLCRNRACCNPDHIEVTTNRTNVMRGVGASAVNAKKATCPQGHAYDRQTTFGGRTARVCTICIREKDARRRKRPSRLAQQSAYEKAYRTRKKAANAATQQPLPPPPSNP